MILILYYGGWSLHYYFLGCFLLRLFQMMSVLHILVHNHIDNAVLLKVNFHPLFQDSRIETHSKESINIELLLLFNLLTVVINRF